MLPSRSLCVILLLSSVPCFGQTTIARAATETPRPLAVTAAPTPILAPVHAGSPSPVWQDSFKRWVDLREMNFSERYRSVFDSNNAHEYNQGQQRSIVDGKFKFDQQGRYGIVFHASTGKYFNWAYADFMGGGNAKAFQLSYTKADAIQQTAMDAYLTPTRIAQQGASGGWAFYVRRL